MNTLEDKVRAALRETAGQIAPASVPPLRLHDDRRRPGPPNVTRRRWPAWLTPLAAAASVAIVIAASLAISGVLHVRQPGTGAARRQAGPFAGVPPYYLVLRGTNPSPTALQPQSAVVKETATGAVVARITPPKPYGTFVAVTAAADDRTFVLAASPWRVHHVDGGVDVPESPTTVLPAPPRPARPPGPPDGTAHRAPAGRPQRPWRVSPDGSKLAVAVRGGEAGGPSAAITVFNLATGSERVWTWPGGGPITNNAGGLGEVLSWTADGRTLAFQQWVGNSIHVRLLDTTTSGGSLQSDSRLALQWKGDAEPGISCTGGSATSYSATAPSSPGRHQDRRCHRVLTKHPLSSELAFTEFSASTGKVVKVLGRWPIPGLYPGQTQDVLWTNSSASTLIVLAHVPGTPTKDPRSINSAGYSIEFGVLRGNQFTPLPGAPNPGPGSWPVW